MGFVWFGVKIIKKTVGGQKQSRPGMLAGQGKRKRGYRRCGRDNEEWRGLESGLRITKRIVGGRKSRNYAAVAQAGGELVNK